MGIIGALLTLPILGGPKMTHWLALKLTEEAERAMLDEGALRGELLDLQERFDAGDVEEEEYDLQEKALLERLTAIREAKAERSREA